MDLLGEMQGDMQTTYNDVLFSCRHGERIVCELGVFPLDPAERDGFIGDSVCQTNCAVYSTCSGLYPFK